MPPTQKHKSSTELVICNLKLIVMQHTLLHQKPEAEQQAITTLVIMTEKIFNGPICVLAKVIKAVLSSAAEVEAEAES